MPFVVIGNWKFSNHFEISINWQVYLSWMNWIVIEISRICESHIYSFIVQWVQRNCLRFSLTPIRIHNGFRYESEAREVLWRSWDQCWRNGIHSTFRMWDKACFEPQPAVVIGSIMIPKLLYWSILQWFKQLYIVRFCTFWECADIFCLRRTSSLNLIIQLELGGVNKYINKLVNSQVL